MSIFSPAFCNTTCASIDLLMFDEHTVPNDNFDGWRSASGGGIPGGVDERCRPGTFMAKTKSTCMSCVRRARGNQQLS